MHPSTREAKKIYPNCYEWKITKIKHLQKKQKKDAALTFETRNMEMKSREGNKKEEEKRDGNSLSTEKYNIQLQKSKLLFLLLLPLLLMLLFLLISS